MTSLTGVSVLGLTICPTCSRAGITFERWFGGPGNDGGYHVQQTADGGYIIAGRTNKAQFPVQNYDVLLTKTDARGYVEWTRTYGGAAEDWARSVQQCSSGDYVVVGATYVDDGDNFTSDVYLLKVDCNGDTIWTRTYGGVGWDRGHWITPSGDSGFVIVGSTTSRGEGGADVYLLKVDAVGDTIWTRTFGMGSAQIGESVQQTADEGYVIAGWSLSSSEDSNGVLLVKTNSSGHMEWMKCYGDDLGAAYSVEQTRDGGYIVCGHKAEFGNGGWQVWLLKTDGLGDTIWTRDYGGHSEDWGYCAMETEDAGYVIVGHTWSYGAGSQDIYLIRTDCTGDTLWTRTFGGADGDGGRFGQRTNDGGYIIVGHTGSYGAGPNDVYLVKTNNLGTLAGWDATDTDLFSVSQTFPTPCAGAASIEYRILEECRVTVSIFNSASQLLKTPLDEIQRPGDYGVKWDGNNALGLRVPSGVYFWRITAGRRTATRKLVVVR